MRYLCIMKLSTVKHVDKRNTFWGSTSDSY